MGKKKNVKTKTTADTARIDNIEAVCVAQKLKNFSKGSNGSINIIQNDTTQKFNYINTNTLATSHFSIKSNNGDKLETKVSTISMFYVQNEQYLIKLVC